MCISKLHHRDKKNKIMSMIDDFIKIVDEIYGIYLDSTAGFWAIRNNLMNAQLSMSKQLSLSMEDLDRRLYSYGKGDPNKKGSYSLHDCTQGLLKERNKDDGRNHRIIAGLCLVMIYQYWENHYRQRVAEENGVTKEDIRWDIMGDLKIFRESIIHHRGIAISKVKNCKILKWFNAGEIININNLQFEEIIRSIKTSKYETR